MEPRENKVTCSPPVPAGPVPRSARSGLPPHDGAPAPAAVVTTLAPAWVDNPRPRKRGRGGLHSRTATNRAYERSRRARMAEALAELRCMLFPAGEIEDASSAAFMRPPTEVEVLTAAVDALKRMRANRSAADEKMVVAMQVVADDTAQPECATSLPETHWEQLGRVSTTCLCAMVREFQTEPRRDVVTTAFEAATGCIQPRPPKSPPPTGKRLTSVSVCEPWLAAARGLSPRQRSALVGRLFRLGTPVNMEVLDRMGMRPSTNAGEMTDFLRTSWRIPENRRCFAEIRCLWFAPHLCGSPIDKLPVERLVMQLQRLVEGVAHVFTAKSPSPGEDDSFGSTVQDALVNRIPAVEPLWEDTAASMGLPRNLEGVARLIRAVTSEMDARVVDLAYYCLAMLTTAPQLVACQQALCEL